MSEGVACQPRAPPVVSRSRPPRRSHLSFHPGGLEALPQDPLYKAVLVGGVGGSLVSGPRVFTKTSRIFLLKL